MRKIQLLSLIIFLSLSCAVCIKNTVVENKKFEINQPSRNIQYSNPSSEKNLNFAIYGFIYLNETV